jgi:hypothetical protein
MDLTQLADTGDGAGSDWFTNLAGLAQTGANIYGTVTGSNKPATPVATVPTAAGLFTGKNLAIIGGVLAALGLVWFFVIKRK